MMKARFQSGVTVKSRIVEPSRVATIQSNTCPNSPDLADLVRRKAYEIYEARCRGGVEGCAESDWMLAEGELAVQSSSNNRVVTKAGE